MTEESTAQRIETAERLVRIEGALSTMSFDVADIKATLREQNGRLSGGLANLLEWRAAHDAASAPRIMQHDVMLGRVQAVESKTAVIEDRQVTHRTILLATVSGTLIALAKAAWEWVAK